MPLGAQRFELGVILSAPPVVPYELLVNLVRLCAPEPKFVLLKELYESVTIHEFNWLGDVLARGTPCRICEVTSCEENALLSSCSDGTAEFPDVLRTDGASISFALERNLCRDQWTDAKVSLPVNTSITHATSHFDVLHADVAK